MRTVQILFILALLALVWIARKNGGAAAIRRVAEPASPLGLLPIASESAGAAELVDMFAARPSEAASTQARAVPAQPLSAAAAPVASEVVVPALASEVALPTPAREGALHARLIPQLVPEQCTELSCAKHHEILEPSWAELAFQPAIDWMHGGVRGDCVAGEYEYIIDKYCSPPAKQRRPPPRGDARWYPDEERLSKVDVHTSGLPQGSFAQLAHVNRGRTLLVMGDSVMEQFYNALQCFLRKEALELPYDAEMDQFMRTTRPLWLMGKRKKPPKLPQRVKGEMRMMYARVTTVHLDEVDAAIGTADTIVVNWGLHYQGMDLYKEDLLSAFAKLEAHASKPGRAVIIQETGAQHFKASDRRGYSTGEWEFRDKSQDGQCSCQRTEDFNVNSRNKVLHEVMATGRFPHLRILPFYNLTRPRWRWHFGNCTHRPNGWNYDTCCDCTHFCFSPTMWKAHLRNLVDNLVDYVAS